MTDRDALHRTLNDLLQSERFKDYAPNGLQVEGRREVKVLVTGVTASLALIEAAIAARADAILVHHGLFWKGYDGRVTGWMRQRLALLLAHDINVFAYHLPLDAHRTLGNNAQLGLRLGLTAQAWFGEQDLGCIGSVPEDLTQTAYRDAQALAAYIETTLGRTVTLVPAPLEQNGRVLPIRPLRRVAWCTGGAQSYFEAAIAAGADAFITGEISEPQAHYARECGVAYLACGHHATERYGVQAVGAHVAAGLGLEHVFIDIDNPA